MKIRGGKGGKRMRVESGMSVEASVIARGEAYRKMRKAQKECIQRHDAELTG